MTLDLSPRWLTPEWDNEDSYHVGDVIRIIPWRGATEWVSAYIITKVAYPHVLGEPCQIGRVGYEDVQHD